MANGLQQIVNPASFYGGANIADAMFKKNEQTGQAMQGATQSLQFMAEQSRLRNVADQQQKQNEVENAQRQQTLAQGQQTLDQNKQSNADKLDYDLSSAIIQYGDEKTAGEAINRLLAKHNYEPIEFKKKPKEATSDISIGEYRYYKTPEEAANASKALGSQSILQNTPYELYTPKGEQPGTRRAKVLEIYNNGDYTQNGKRYKGGQVIKPELSSFAEKFGIPENTGGIEWKEPANNNIVIIDPNTGSPMVVNKSTATSTQVNTGTSNGIGSPKDRKDLDVFKNSLNGLTQKDRDKYNFGSEIVNMLNQKNPVSDQGVSVKIPRLMGEVGNLSEYEQKKWGGSKALLARLKQATTEAATGLMSEDNRALVKSMVVDLQKIAGNRANKIIENQSNSFSVNRKTLNKDAFTKEISPLYIPLNDGIGAGAGTKINATKIEGKNKALSLMD